MKFVLSGLCAAICLSLLAFPAYAKFEVCNSAIAKQSVAIAYRADGEWISEGWWGLEQGECKTLVSGDLKSRYFYYRATTKGGTFKGEGYRFCTDPKPFTIKGKTDCESRGFRKEEFSEIDTQKNASFKLTLVESAPSGAEFSKPTKNNQKAQIQPQTTQPKQGSLGEPFSVGGIFQGCDGFDGRSVCMFHAEGYKWHVYYDEGTPNSVFNALSKLSAGQPISVKGDLISYGDITTEAAAYSFETYTPRTEEENTIAGLQGWWRSLDDIRSTMQIYGSEVFDYYDGEGVLEQYVQYADHCPAAEGLKGPFLIMFAPENYNDPLCYTIEGWDAIVLQLGFVGGAGDGLLTFERFYP